MFDFGLGQMILLGAIALIAIGPKQLPEVAKTLGRFIGELKKYSGELTRQVIEARETTNFKLMLNQQNQQAGLGTPAPAGGPSPVTAPVATPGIVHPPSSLSYSRFHEYDHDPTQLSFEFNDFIDCYPSSWPSSIHHES